ncbi:hypothetical protein GOODEAATRI_026095 [Goodea atripinnis]|uniref:Caspase family p10 domain-containing protein n=1 Tax=Goodea atripinnis TaxID=208336 RepID=A0ABV0N4D5_9TELE
MSHNIVLLSVNKRVSFSRNSVYDALFQKGVFTQDMIDEIKSQDIVPGYPVERPNNSPSPSFEVSPEEAHPSVGGEDDQTDAIPTSSSSDSLSTSDEVDARTSLPTPSDILVSYSTFPGYVSWRDTRAGSWYVETLDRILEENAATDDLVTMLMMVSLTC